MAFHIMYCMVEGVLHVPFNFTTRRRQVGSVRPSLNDRLSTVFCIVVFLIVGFHGTTAQFWRPSRQAPLHLIQPGRSSLAYREQSPTASNVRAENPQYPTGMSASPSQPNDHSESHQIQNQHDALQSYFQLRTSAPPRLEYTVTPTCPSTYRYQNGKCVTKTMVPLINLCPEGATKRPNGDCVKMSPPSFECPSGSTPNAHFKGGHASDCLFERLTPKTQACPSGSVMTTSADGAAECVLTITREPTCPEGTALAPSHKRCARYIPKRKQCPPDAEPHGDVCATREMQPAIARCPVGMTPEGSFCKMTTRIEPVCPPNTIDTGDGRCLQYKAKILSCPQGYSPHGSNGCRGILREPLRSVCANGADPADSCKVMILVPLSPHCPRGKLYGGNVCSTIEEERVKYKCPEEYNFSPVLPQTCEKTIHYDCSERREEVKCSTSTQPTPEQSNSTHETSTRRVPQRSDDTQQSSTDGVTFRLPTSLQKFPPLQITRPPDTARSGGSPTRAPPIGKTNDDSDETETLSGMSAPQGGDEGAGFEGQGSEEAEGEIESVDEGLPSRSDETEVMEEEEEEVVDDNISEVVGPTGELWTENESAASVSDNVSSEAHRRQLLPGPSTTMGKPHFPFLNPTALSSFPISSLTSTPYKAQVSNSQPHQYPVAGSFPQLHTTNAARAALPPGSTAAHAGLGPASNTARVGQYDQSSIAHHLGHNASLGLPSSNPTPQLTSTSSSLPSPLSHVASFAPTRSAAPTGGDTTRSRITDNGLSSTMGNSVSLAHSQATQAATQPPTPRSEERLPLCHTVLVIEQKTCTKVIHAQAEPICPPGSSWNGERVCLSERHEAPMMKCDAHLDGDANCVVEETTAPMRTCPAGFTRKLEGTMYGAGVSDIFEISPHPTAQETNTDNSNMFAPHQNDMLSRQNDMLSHQGDVCEKVEVVAPTGTCPFNSSPPDCESYTQKRCPNGSCVTTHTERASVSCPAGFNLRSADSNGGSSCYRLNYTDRLSVCPRDTEEVDVVTCASYIPLTEHKETKTVALQETCAAGLSDIGGSCVKHEVVPGEVKCPERSWSEFDDAGRATVCVQVVDSIITCPPDSIEEDSSDGASSEAGNISQKRCWIYSSTDPVFVDTVVQQG